MASKLYGWDSGNIAKNSPKATEKQPTVMWSFSMFQKSSERFQRKLLQSFHTIWSPICAMASKLIGWKLRNIARSSPEKIKKQPFLNFFQVLQKLSLRFERSFLQSFYTTPDSYMCNGNKFVCLWFEKHGQKNPRSDQKNIFGICNSLKNSVRFEGSFSKTLYAILGSSVCNGKKVVWLWSDKHSWKQHWKDQKIPFWTLSVFWISP